MAQLLLHLWGDYILQSDWMASNKTKAHLPAAIHALCYSLPFLLLRPGVAGWLLIIVTHFFIDRYRLASYVVMAKNILGCPFLRTEGKYITSTGYPADMQPWMAVWLLIVADNTLHLTINFLALRYL